MGSLPHVVEDCMGVLQLYSDGTISRSEDINFPFPIVADNSVAFRDVLYDVEHGLHLRLYKPAVSTRPKLPVLYFIHGGGFCVGSRSWPNSHNCCVRLASGLDVLVVAPDYRLAPEHRLPAAMDDAVSAILWLQRQASSSSSTEVDAWMKDRVDFERVFVMGDSSGGNIAHHLAVRLGSHSEQLQVAPVRIRGYILMAPFFGGVERTESEEGPPEEYLNLEALDRFWRLSLPVGEDRDHPLANPFGGGRPWLEGVGLEEPILVMVGGREMLKDRVENYAIRLRGLGKRIEYVEFEGKQHGFFTNCQDSELGERVLHHIDHFILHNSAPLNKSDLQVLADGGTN